MMPEPIQNLGVLGTGDRAGGDAAERTDILKVINDQPISPVVFVTADSHRTVIDPSPTAPLTPVQVHPGTTGIPGSVRPISPRPSQG